MASYDLIARFRQMIGDLVVESQVWTDDQSGECIDEGFLEYTYGARTEGDETASVDDTTQSLKLARSYAMYELASNTALFFKWRDQQKDIDKSMTPEMCRRIGKDLHEQVMGHRKAKD